MKILVVEDDENSRVLQHTMLEASGYEVFSAGNGREALELIAQARPDLIISDIMMPEMDGFALCRALKSNPAWADIPFVVYSATFTTGADQELAAELGASRFLIKPMDPDEFLEQIRQVLAQGVSTSVAAPPPLDLNIVDARYAQALARKLDKKVQELKDTRAQLESSAENLQRIQECYWLAQKIARVGSWDWNLADDSCWWSDEMYELLGVSPDQAVAGRMALLARIAEADRERFARALELAAERGIEFSLDHGVLGPKDEPRQMHSAAEIAATDPQTGKPLRIVCAMRDITQQCQMEADKARMEASLRQAQKMEALGALAGGIAHDFNNVLTGILGNAELLRMHFPPLSTEENDSLGQIVAASRRATELVRQILTFSRRGEQTKAPTDLRAVVKEALKFIRAAIPSTIAIRMRLDENCPPVMADSTQIYQVVMNLCVNASHAMLPNPGTLEIALLPVQIEAWHELARVGLNAGQHVLLKVSDTGCGMDAATRERIFEPYFTTKKKGEGTGLGLTVVHGIILAHNGHITVSSELGKGTTFSIYLPAIKRPTEQPAAAAEELVGGRGERILVVDDESALAHVVANMLEELGYQVTEVHRSPEALELFQRAPERFQLVLTDLTMPGMDGLTLAQALIKLRPGLPVILCTGFSEVVAEKSAADCGISAVLTKPFMLRELANAIRKALPPA